MYITSHILAYHLYVIYDLLTTLVRYMGHEDIEKKGFILRSIKG